MKVVLVKWRTLAFFLLAVVVSLNVFIFVTLPKLHSNALYERNEKDTIRAVGAGAGHQRYDSQGISHLQFPRKRFNKSNFTSESLGADGGGRRAGGLVGEKGGGGGGGAWEEGVGDHPPVLLRGQGGGDQARKSGSSELSRQNLTDPVVDAFVSKLVKEKALDVLPGSNLKSENYWAYLRRQRLRRKSGPQLPAFKNYKATTNWERFQAGIRQHHLYDPDSRVVEDLIKDLTLKPIIDTEQKEGGTQLKLIMTLEDEGQALLKPMRYPRTVETLPDHFYFADYERHIAEIAAFHLDRALGYNRVPPTAGRVVNMTHDIKRLAESKLARTFFISPAGNLCFHGTCSYYCDSGHPICGHPDMLEGSMMAFLPPEKMARRQTWRNPWKRSYSKHRKAYWEVYSDLCEKVRDRSPYNTGRRLLDIIDMSIMDFFMGNQDRHHYETFRIFGNETFILHLDHGRGFGKSLFDDMSCLAPMLQCCLVRSSTLQRLVRLYSGPQPLSVVMRDSLAPDAIAPVLIERHLRALDRRLVIILKSLAQCMEENDLTYKDMIVDDGVY